MDEAALSLSSSRSLARLTLFVSFSLYRSLLWSVFCIVRRRGHGGISQDVAVHGNSRLNANGDGEVYSPSNKAVKI